MHLLLLQSIGQPFSAMILQMMVPMLQLGEARQMLDVCTLLTVKFCKSKDTNRKADTDLLMY